MKNLYMHAVIGSSGWDHVLIISKTGFFESNLLGWAHMTQNFHIGRRTNLILI